VHLQIEPWGANSSGGGGKPDGTYRDDVTIRFRGPNS
jgi:hypothetical protein